MLYESAVKTKKEYQMRIILAGILACLLTPSVYAQTNQTEILTISTYYPSPYGIYEQMNVQRSVIFDPQANIAGLANPHEGEMVYSNSEDQFYYHNGNTWVSQSSGVPAGTVITRTCPWGSDYRNTTPAASVIGGWGNQCGADGLNCCVPAACPVGWLDIGTEAQATDVHCPEGSDCHWQGGVNGDAPVAVGQVVRICVKS
jgi:hypothetical protein